MCFAHWDKEAPAWAEGTQHTGRQPAHAARLGPLPPEAGTQAGRPLSTPGVVPGLSLSPGAAVVASGPRLALTMAAAAAVTAGGRSLGGEEDLPWKEPLSGRPADLTLPKLVPEAAT